MPFIHVNVIPGLFITPAFSSFFPILPSDVPRIQDWLKTKVKVIIVDIIENIPSIKEIQIYSIATSRVARRWM